MALTFKTYHDWGYRFNDSGRIDELTTTQERLIGLAEAAEAYIQQVHRDQANAQHTTQTAQRQHDHKARLAAKSRKAQQQAKVN